MKDKERKGEIVKLEDKNPILKSIHKNIWYILIFSIIGLALEGVYSLVYSAISSSQKGFVLGPFCFIYGVGATLLISVLSQFKEHKVKMFIVAVIIGGLYEYCASFIIDALTNGRIWNLIYSLNINGRTCFIHAIAIAILSVIIYLAKPILDKLILKITGKVKVILDVAISLLIIAEILSTIWGLAVYKQRASDIYYEVKIFEEKTFIEEIADKVFSNEFLVKYYPNARFLDNNGNIVWMRDELN